MIPMKQAPGIPLGSESPWTCSQPRLLTLVKWVCVMCVVKFFSNGRPLVLTFQAPNIPADVNFQPKPTSEKPNGDITNSFLDSDSMYASWDLPLEISMSQKIRDTAETPNLAQIPNDGSLDLNGVIDPELIQSFTSGGKPLNRSSSSASPGLCSDLLRQIATAEWPATAEKTVTVQYDTIDEAKQALLDARKKTLQKLQFINQQIEDLERRKQNRNEAVGDLDSVKGSFL